ncbi:MAG: hypothetical protein WCO00_04075 [Rhodospirillaceae bacterium]
MRKLVPVLALSLGLFAAPAVSQAQTLPAVMTGPSQAQVTLAAFPSSLHDIERMSVEQAVAIVGGAALGALLVDSFVERGIVTLAGTVIGAVGGNIWYEKHYWPF